ncbi:MAG: phosphatase PAP2 family protein [Bacteroidota bacterium]
MEKRLAQIISYLFHPLLIPSYTLLIVFNANAYFVFALPFTAKLLMLIMMVVSTVCIPILLFIIFRYRRIIVDFQMKTKEERMYPYLSITCVYFITYYLFSKLQIPPIFNFYLLIATLLSLVLLFINLIYKISGHTAAMGGITGLCIGLYFQFNLNLLFVILMLIFCSGLVGFARLKLNSHKPSEVYSGFLVGVVIFLAMTLII